MKNEASWQETKFNSINGRLKASRDPKEVSVSSRLVADLIADFYSDVIPKHATGCLLDLGCGKAPLYSTYRNFVSEIVCVDWQKSLHGTNVIDFEMDLNKPLNFENGSFDTIILSDVLEHISNPALLVSEISRILRPSGKLLMNVPFFYCLHEEPYDFYRYTSHGLKKLMDDANLKIDTIEPVGGVPEILTDICSKMIIRLPYVGDLIAIFIQSICSRWVRTKLGKRFSSGTGQRFPLGYKLIALKPTNS
jgi:SAM-dependent methyltransferase